MVQLSVVPADGLSIHKTQALSIPHVVKGCLEGIFAWGQLYVLLSRVTDPANLHLIGLPPKDLIDRIAAELSRLRKAKIEAIDPDEAFSNCTEVSGEWNYDIDNRGGKSFSERFKQRYQRQRQIPMVHKIVEAVLNPQPAAARVYLRLLAFIDKVDDASRVGGQRPEFIGDDGEPIFPPDERWWMTELSVRKVEQRLAREELLEDGPAESEEDELSSDEPKPKDSDEDTDPFSDNASSGEDMPETITDDGTQQNDDAAVRLPLARTPHKSDIAFWRRDASPQHVLREDFVRANSSDESSRCRRIVMTLVANQIECCSIRSIVE